MSVRRALPLLMLPLVLYVPAFAAGGKVEHVAFTTQDGFFLKGDYYPGRPGGPVVLLLHQLGSTRADYAGLARLLQSRGMNALAYDARGHGESTIKGGEPVRTVTWEDFSNRDFLDMTKDITAALKFLREKKGVGKAPVGIVGASIQSSTALVYAASHPEVKALALLSPGLGYHDIDTLRPMKRYGRRPVFIAASEEDTYSLESAKRLDNIASGDKKFEIYRGAGHGAKMFPNAPMLPAHIADWLSAHLK